MEVKEAIYFDQKGSEDVEISQVVQQDVSAIIRDNHYEAERSNGFTDERSMRKVMSLSTVDYLNALKLGYHLDTEDPALLRKEVHRYLREIGQENGAQTVRHILTPGSHSNIIVR